MIDSMESKDLPERGTVGFRGTADYRWRLKAAAAGRRKSLQGMLEDAVDLYLEVSAERHAAGDARRLKEYAQFLAMADTEAIKEVEGRIAGTLRPQPAAKAARPELVPKTKRVQGKAK